MALLEHLQQRGLRIGVISRGYGRHSSGCVEVNQDSCPADAGDEPLLIQRRTGAPVVVAERRSEAVDLLLARHPDTELIISDDGLQHRALRHDYALCVFDNRGIGNGMLLPAGPCVSPGRGQSTWYCTPVTGRLLAAFVPTGSLPLWRCGRMARRWR